MHRDDADRAGAAEGSGGHGWAGERHHRHAPAPPAQRKGRAATRVSPCAVRKPGQDGWRDRQSPGPAPDQQTQPPSVSGFSREIRALGLGASLSIRWAITHGTGQ
jgi:hypothetical protein